MGEHYEPLKWWTIGRWWFFSDDVAMLATDEENDNYDDEDNDNYDNEDNDNDDDEDWFDY